MYRDYHAICATACLPSLLRGTIQGVQETASQPANGRHLNHYRCGPAYCTVHGAIPLRAVISLHVLVRNFLTSIVGRKWSVPSSIVRYV